MLEPPADVLLKYEGEMGMESSLPIHSCAVLLSCKHLEQEFRTLVLQMFLTFGVYGPAAQPMTEIGKV